MPEAAGTSNTLSAGTPGAADPDTFGCCSAFVPELPCSTCRSVAIRDSPLQNWDQKGWDILGKFS